MGTTSVQRWSESRGALASAVGFALLFPSLMTWFYFVALARPAGESTANPAMQLVYATGKTIQFAFPVLAFVALQRRWPRPGAPSFRGLGLGLAFGLFVSAGIFALYFGFLQGSPLFEKTPAMLSAKLREFNLATPAGFIGLGIFISVIHSLMEEYYWRWFVFGQLQRLIPLKPAIIVSSLGFMGHHVIVLAVYFPGHFWTAALPFSLCVAAGGGVWAWLYHRTGSVYAPWLSHLIVDTAIMAVGYEMLFG